MAVDKPYRLAFLSAGLGFCCFCWVLAIVSFTAVFDPIWNLMGLFQSKLYDLGLAGHGHSLLKGMSRAFRCLWQGHISEAVAYNMGSVYLFLLMMLGCVLMPLFWFFRKRFGA